MLMIGNRVMMTTASPAATQPAATMTAMIAAIEADLDRIIQALAAARRLESSGGCTNPIQLASELTSLKAETTRIADRVCSLPIEMTPLALLSLDSEQLTLIKGVDAHAARILNENGLHRFADIAALMPEDVKELGRQLGSERRISREGWIEQAALLEKGIETAYGARVRSGDLACIVALPSEAQPKPATKATPAPEQKGASAEVIDLASRRTRGRPLSLASASRVGGMAIAAALVLALTLNAGNIAGMAWGNGKAACGPSLAAAGKCTVAQLP